MAFSHVNQLMTKKEITKLVDRVYRLVGLHEVVVMLDKLKDLGFSYATKAGVSICIDNMHIPSRKGVLIDRAQADVSQVTRSLIYGPM
jgi:DNA-directed RNA polymerase subunit beta'